MKWSSRRIVLVSGAVVLVVIAVFIFKGDALKLKEYVAVEEERYQGVVVATGNVQSREDIVIVAEEEGTVRGVNRLPGANVKKGTLLVSMENSTLREELETQRSLLEKETTQLDRFLTGPEKRERERIEADNNLALQSLENEVRIALVSSQYAAGKLEDDIRRTVDVLFDHQGNNYYFTGTASGNTKTTINTGRNQLENIFQTWRQFSDDDYGTPEKAVERLEQFDRELEEIHGMIIAIYDIFTTDRFLSEENEQTFHAIALVRTDILNAILGNIRNITAINAQIAQYRLAVAQTKESLAGGTETDLRTQQAIIEAEQARLNALEARLQKTSILAPFDGIIGEIFVNQGEFVLRGSNIMRFVSDGGYELQVDVTEVEIPSIEVGQEMTAYIDALDRTVGVAVRTIDTTEKRINNVPVYSVVFDILEGGASIRPGMTVDVEIPVGEADTITVVLRDAVQTGRNGTFVIVKRDGKEVTVPVVVGSSGSPDTVSVKGDVRVGETAIILKENE